MPGFFVHLLMFERRRDAVPMAGPGPGPCPWQGQAPIAMGPNVAPPMAGPPCLYTGGRVGLSEGTYVLESSPEQNIRNMKVYVSHDHPRLLQLGSRRFEHQGDLSHHAELTPILEARFGPMQSWSMRECDAYAHFCNYLAGPLWCEAKVFRNYDGTLDFYFRGATDLPPYRWYRYVLADVREPTDWWQSAVPPMCAGIVDHPDWVANASSL